MADVVRCAKKSALTWVRKRGRGCFSISLVAWIVCSVGRAGVVSLFSFARYPLVAVDVKKTVERL
jgi:hypothetical protein